MYDNNCLNSSERNCRQYGSICIKSWYLVVLAAVVAGIAAYSAFNAGLFTNVLVVLLGALGIVLILGVILIALVNNFLTRQQKLCCCAKQRAIGFVICAIITLIAICLFFGVASIAAVLIAVIAAFFILTVLFFIGFYHCFLKCRCEVCDNIRSRRCN